MHDCLKNENLSPVCHAWTLQLGFILLRFVNDNYSRCLGVFSGTAYCHMYEP